MKAADKELELLIVVDDNVPPLLKGDSLRLSQILLNLANNAIKFTEEGEVRLTVELLKQADSTVMLKFSVKDTGVGISHEQQKELFDVFTQADTSVTRRYGGTGLGLSISKKLAALMGGDIYIESELGQGSVFTLVIPFEYGDDSTTVTRKVVPKEIRGKRVLVVDDHSETRDILSHYTMLIGLDTFQASSGEEAVEKVCHLNEHFDLILMDWKMPGMSGLDAVKRIREDKAIEYQPMVIMVTAYSRDELSQEDVADNIVDFIAKPVTPSVLHDAILDAFVRDDRHHKSNDYVVPTFENLKGAKILLVDDNEINLAIAKELLELGGLAVKTATNGQKAIEELSITSDFDGVLMDIHMPVMDGYAATREIRKESRFHSLPIIAMTANAMVRDREKALEVGMNDHIAKPIDTNTMFSVLAKWISSSHLPNSDSLDKEIEKLVFYLEQGDTEAIDFVRSIESPLSKEWHQNLIQLVDDFQFEEAKKFINISMDEINTYSKYK